MCGKYPAVAGLLTGIVPYQTPAGASPVADAMLRIGRHRVAAVISAGAIAGLTRWLRFVIRMASGLGVYFSYSRRHNAPAVES